MHDLVVGWDRDHAEAGEVAGPGEEAAEGGAAAEPQVRGRHGSPPCQRHHAPHHPRTGPARQDARRRVHRHALMTSSVCSNTIVDSMEELIW